MAKSLALAINTHEAKIQKDLPPSVEHIAYVVFDKEGEAYVLDRRLGKYQKMSEMQGQYLFSMYSPESKESLGGFLIMLERQSAFLELLTINSQKHLRKGLGSKMLDVCQFFSFLKGKEALTGEAIAFNTDFINTNRLKMFYIKNGFNIESGNQLFKKIDREKIKKIAQNMATVKKGNAIFKIIFPDNTKQQVMQILTGKKTSFSNENTQQM